MYDVYGKKCFSIVLNSIMQNVKERVQIKFELACTINRTACWMHTQILQHSMTGNQ